jgi:hypothetical protein
LLLCRHCGHGSVFIHGSTGVVVVVVVVIVVGVVVAVVVVVVVVVIVIIVVAVLVAVVVLVVVAADVALVNPALTQRKRQFSVAFPGVVFMDQFNVVQCCFCVGIAFMDQLLFMDQQ